MRARRSIRTLPKRPRHSARRPGSHADVFRSSRPRRDGRGRTVFPAFSISLPPPPVLLYGAGLLLPSRRPTIAPSLARPAEARKEASTRHFFNGGLDDVVLLHRQTGDQGIVESAARRSLRKWV